MEKKDDMERLGKTDRRESNEKGTKSEELGPPRGGKAKS